MYKKTTQISTQKELCKSLKRYGFIQILALFLSCSLVMFCGLCLNQAFAASEIKIPDTINKKVNKDLSSWSYVQSNRPGVAAHISKGARKDTEKVTRVVENRIKGFVRNLRMDIAKEISLKYEVYTSGPNKGKIYKVYKPSIKHTAKSARYLGFLKLTVKPKVEVNSYSINKKGEAIIVLSEQTSFTLPRQFPLKQSALSELLRRAFKIESLKVTRTFTIKPYSKYGALTLRLSEH